MCSASLSGGNQVDGFSPFASQYNGLARNSFPEHKDSVNPGNSDDNFANGLRHTRDMCLKFVIDPAACLTLDFWCPRIVKSNFFMKPQFLKIFENVKFWKEYALLLSEGVPKLRKHAFRWLYADRPHVACCTCISINVQLLSLKKRVLGMIICLQIRKSGSPDTDMGVQLFWYV